MCMFLAWTYCSYVSQVLCICDNYLPVAVKALAYEQLALERAEGSYPEQNQQHVQPMQDYENTLYQTHTYICIRKYICIHTTDRLW